MTDLYDKIASERNALQKIGMKIPGYRGYAEMEERRAADRMIREYVVRLLKEQMTQLVAVEKKLISKGGIKFASKSKSAKLNFQTFIDKVNTAMPGYAFFSAIKVGKEE